MSTLYADPLAESPEAAFTSLTNPAQLRFDDTVAFRSGLPGSFRWLGSGSAAYGLVTVRWQTLTARVYFQLDALPGGTSALIQCQGTAPTFAFQINASGFPTPKIGTGRAETAFSFAALTPYRLDLRLDASGTTWTLDYQVSDGASEKLLHTGVQLRLTGQSRDTFTALRLGQNGSRSLTGNAQDLKVTDQWTDYPLGAYTPEPPAIVIPPLIEGIPTRGILFGLAPKIVLDAPTAMTMREASLGCRLPISHTFRSWHDMTRKLTTEIALCNSGHVPLVSCPGARSVPADAVAGIAAGAYDSEITTFCTNLKRLPAPFVTLRWSWEMNGNANPWRDSPNDYRAAFDHVHGILQAAVGATKVLMAFCPQRRPGSLQHNNYQWADYEPENYDIWALDSYAHYETEEMATLITTGDVPAPAPGNNWYEMGQTRGKPMMICESGCREQSDPLTPVGVTQSFTKASWVQRWRTDARRFPDIFAWVYFDEAATHGDWRMDTDAATPGSYDATSTNATFAAFMEVAADPYWTPYPGALKSPGTPSATSTT